MEFFQSHYKASAQDNHTPFREQNWISGYEPEAGSRPSFFQMLHSQRPLLKVHCLGSKYRTPDQVASSSEDATYSPLPCDCII